MCDMDLVSIIVPVFNVEKYLQDCVDSLKEQTYENIEMIFVDDGSTDGSAEICDRLASSNILVVHKKNGGVSSARNCGLKIAKGKYILFVDADDKIRPDMVFRLVNAIEKSDADIATCRFEKKYKNKMVYAKADSKGSGAAEEFKFIEAYEASGFDFNTFNNLLRQGKIFVDLRIGQYPDGRTHDHGTGFRIREADEHLLFKKYKRIV